MVLVSTGIEGLDQALQGGLPSGELALVQGEPGSGKTTLGLQFLIAGAAAGDRGLLVTLSERTPSLRAKAAGHGWSLERITIHELTPTDDVERHASRQVIFNNRDVELEELCREVQRVVAETGARRVVIDALSHLRLLAGDAVVYRRHLHALRDFFAQSGATVVATEDEGALQGYSELRAVCGGVIILTQEPTHYGNERRKLRILKIRNHSYQPGVHDFVIETGGIRLFPRLRPEDKRHEIGREPLLSGVDELDELLGGGLSEGTSCLVLGPSGTGKTSLSTLYVHAAAMRGQRAAVFLFDELEETFLMRSCALGMDLRPHLESGAIRIHHIGSGELPPGEFVDLVQQEVDQRGVKVVLIDTLTGYLSAMPDERLLVTQLHELVTYLNRRGVLSIVVVAQHGVMGPEIRAPLDVSYLADTVLLLRHFEAQGSLRQAISVYKKRYGSHGRRIRELLLETGGIRVGSPIARFSGILSGTPRFEGHEQDLLTQQSDK